MKSSAIHAFRGIVTGCAFAATQLLFAGPGNAQGDPELNINSPSIVTIRKSIAARFDVLRGHFHNGVIGLTDDGRIAMHDTSTLTPDSQRVIETLINDDNNDRDTLYREIARLNGRADWEENLRRTFGERWIGRAPSGWYYREAGGKWLRKK